MIQKINVEVYIQTHDLRPLHERRKSILQEIRKIEPDFGYTIIKKYKINLLGIEKIVSLEEWAELCFQLNELIDYQEVIIKIDNYKKHRLCLKR